MATTYEPITSTTLGTAVADVTFTSIPGTFTDLVLVILGEGSTGQPHYMQVNGDTAGNYSWTRLYGTGSVAGSTRQANDTLGHRLHTGNGDTQGVMVTHLMSYSNTNVYKTFLTAGTDEGHVYRHVGLWRSTSAITSIKVYNYTGNWAVGTTVSLYGLKAA